MPDTPLSAGERIAERIRLHVAGSPFRVGGGKELLTVTISIGVAATLGEADTPEALLKRADEAVYEAKSLGRNKVIRQSGLELKNPNQLIDSKGVCTQYRSSPRKRGPRLFWCSRPPGSGSAVQIQ